MTNNIGIIRIKSLATKIFDLMTFLTDAYDLFGQSKANLSLINASNFVQNRSYDASDSNLISATLLILYSVLMNPTRLRSCINWFDWNFYDLLSLKEVSNEIFIKKFKKHFKFNLTEDIDNYITTRIHLSSPFIKIVATENIKIDNSSIEKYKKMLQLKKKYPRETITPTKECDIIWHCHMCDHTNYVADTYHYFGFVLLHSDDIDNIEPHIITTIKLWNEEFKSNEIIAIANITNYDNPNSTVDNSKPNSTVDNNKPNFTTNNNSDINITANNNKDIGYYSGCG